MENRVFTPSAVSPQGTIGLSQKIGLKKIGLSQKNKVCAIIDGHQYFYIYGDG